MERPLLAGRADAIDLRPLHRRVELAAKHGRRVQVAARRLARKDERLVARLPELAPPGAERVDQVRGEVDVAALVVLRRRQMPVRVGAADADHGLDEVDVAPGERRQLTETHPGLERRLEQQPVDALAADRDE